MACGAFELRWSMKDESPPAPPWPSAIGDPPWSFGSAEPDHVLTGQRMQKVWSIDPDGGRHEMRWVVAHPDDRSSWNSSVKNMAAARKSTCSRMKEVPTRRLMLTILALVCCTGTATAQMDHPSKVDLTFNKWYDYEEMTKALHDLAAAYPDLLTLESIGQSYGGLEIWSHSTTRTPVRPVQDRDVHRRQHPWQ